MKIERVHMKKQNCFVIGMMNTEIFISIICIRTYIIIIIIIMWDKDVLNLTPMDGCLLDKASLGGHYNNALLYYGVSHTLNQVYYLLLFWAAKSPKKLLYGIFIVRISFQTLLFSI